MVKVFKTFYFRTNCDCLETWFVALGNSSIKLFVQMWSCVDLGLTIFALWDSLFILSQDRTQLYFFLRWNDWKSPRKKKCRKAESRKTMLGQGEKAERMRPHQGQPRLVAKSPASKQAPSPVSIQARYSAILQISNPSSIQASSSERMQANSPVSIQANHSTENLDVGNINLYKEEITG